MIWCCPRCRGALETGGPERLRCGACGATYDVVAGIPDLRVPGAVWIDLDEDRAAARRLDADTRDLSVEALVRHVYAAREGWTTDAVARRTRQVLAAPGRLRHELSGWLDELTRLPGFVDLGCGPGMLLAAAAVEGRAGIGVDVSLVWLVVAKRLIEHFGGTPVLAAALAEALPLPDGSVPAVVSLDVIEHVGDQEAYLREIDRATAPGGRVALATPNRFSLAAEPHVAVWGVGWVPRRFQAAYVRWRSGQAYEFVRLLSVPDMSRILRRNTHFTPRFHAPPVPQDEIAHASRTRAVLARGYNRLTTSPGLSWVLLAIGPFFHVVGHKRPAAPSRSDDGAAAPIVRRRPVARRVTSAGS